MADDAALVHSHGQVQWVGDSVAAEEPNVLDLEREKHRKRAEKFGVEFVEPSQRRDLRQVARRERLQRPGFATGVDLFTEEEVAKREQRANRFGSSGVGIKWEPPVPNEDDAKRAQRAARFGTEFKPAEALMDVDLLEARREPSLSAGLRREAVYVYGVDVLSTADILRTFADYGPSYVEWINDSSCAVLFADSPSAKRALAGLGTAIPPTEGSELQGLDASDPGNMEYMWHKTAAQHKGSDVDLLMRIATVDDVRAEGRMQSRRLWQSGRGQGGRGRGPRAPRDNPRKRGRDEDAEMADATEEQGTERGEGRSRGRAAPAGLSAAIFSRALGEIAGKAREAREAVTYDDV